MLGHLYPFLKITNAVARENRDFGLCNDSTSIDPFIHKVNCAPRDNCSIGQSVPMSVSTRVFWKQ